MSNAVWDQFILSIERDLKQSGFKPADVETHYTKLSAWPSKRIHWKCDAKFSEFHNRLFQEHWTFEQAWKESRLPERVQWCSKSEEERKSVVSSVQNLTHRVYCCLHI